MRRLIILTLLATACHAQGTFTAASCNYADVNGLINNTGGAQQHQAVNGDVINIPAGACTWGAAQNLVIPSGIGISIRGSGTPNSSTGTFGASASCTATKITDNAGSSTFLMAFSPTFGNATTHISCMDIEPFSTSTTLYAPFSINGTCTASGCPQFRVDNITFGGTTPWKESNNGAQAAAMVRPNDVFGVLDHNTAPNGSDIELYVPAMSSYLGVGSNGDNSWAATNSLGGANNIFAENNSWFAGHLPLEDCEAPGPEGCRFVVRYNQFTATGTSAFGICGNHGTETGGRSRGGPEYECYNNTYTVASTATAPNVYGTRSGTVMFFNNNLVINPGGFIGGWGGYNLYRNVFAASPWAACGGLNSVDPYDQNDNTVAFTGTVSAETHGTGVSNTMTDNSANFPNLTPNGDPYTVYDVGNGTMAEIKSNTATQITTWQPISESSWYSSGMFTVGHTYQIIRSSVCIDQPGRGPFGTLLSGATPTPTGWVNEPLTPIYDWGNTSSGGHPNNASGASANAKLIPFRDYFTQSATQVSQTSPTSPFACDGGLGTGWGIGSRRPASCSGACVTNNPGCGYWSTDTSGGLAANTLYVWKSGAWSAYYTPYTYPHPLTVAASPAAAPTFLPGTGTYTSTQSVTISTASTGAVICYSMTSSAPATNGASGCATGTLYSGPVSVSSTEVLYAVAGGTGFTDSAVSSAVYVFGPSMTNPVIFAGVVPTHTFCKTALSTTQVCFADDCQCLWLSVNGAAYIPLGVTSVNGKTGAVTLSLQ